MNLRALEQYIEERMAAAAVPGVAVAIVQGREVMYAGGFGVTGVEDGGVPVTPQTIFRIGSTTKPLTGTAIMRLVEAGKLDLDRPIKAYVEWIAFSEEGAGDCVTLRMLLCHTSGLPHDAELFGARDPGGLEAYVREKIPHYPLLARPGRMHAYSNVGICLAGYIAEVVSGRPFADLMHELVFAPLEMERTTFDPLVAMTYPLAQGHQRHKDGTLSVHHRFPDNTAYYPAGFAMSTAHNLANFAMMHLNGGRFHEQQVLAPAAVAAMQRIQADLRTAPHSGYGLTFKIDTYKGERWVGHDGGIGSFGCSFVMAPDAGFAVVVLFNRFAPAFALNRVAKDIFDRVGR
jgi:CubicO group peptidase (beta-lactamase class C family)